MKNNGIKVLDDQKLMEEIAKDQKIRTAISRKDHFWFFNIYFSHYLIYPPALFHKEMFELSQRDDLRLIAIMAFRGSGKSTIMNLSYALWSILGKFERKFVLIVSETQSQAEVHFSDILHELKTNELLSADLGPFEETREPYSVLLKNLNAKIMFVYRGQTIRGMRHGPHRPDLIIIDDIEDSWSVQSELVRDTTYEWFETEIIPAGNSDTTIVILGNLLHEDSFLMRIRENINSGKVSGIFKAYPLLDDLNQNLWLEKFTDENVKQLKKNNSAWKKEYLLKLEKPVNTIIDLLDLTEQASLDKKNSQTKKAVHLGKYVISAPITECYDLGKIDKILDKIENADRAEANHPP